MTAKWEPFWVPFGCRGHPWAEERTPLEQKWCQKWLEVEICGLCGNECFPYVKRHILRVWGAGVIQKGTFGRTHGRHLGLKLEPLRHPVGRPGFLSAFLGGLPPQGWGEGGGRGARGFALKRRLRDQLRAPLKKEKVWRLVIGGLVRRALVIGGLFAACLTRSTPGGVGGFI